MAFHNVDPNAQDLTAGLVERYLVPAAPGQDFGGFSPMHVRRERTAGFELRSRWDRWKAEWDGFWKEPPMPGRARPGTRWDRVATEWRWAPIALWRFLGGTRFLSSACAELSRIVPMRLEAPLGSDPGSWSLTTTPDEQAPTDVGSVVVEAFAQWQQLAAHVASGRDWTRYVPLALVRPCADGVRVYDWEIAVAGYSRFARQDGGYRLVAPYDPLYTIGLPTTAGQAYGLPTRDFPGGSLGAVRKVQWLAYHKALPPQHYPPLSYTHWDQAPATAMAAAARGLIPGGGLTGRPDPAMTAKQWWTIAAWLHRTGGDGGPPPTLWALPELAWHAQFVQQVDALAALDGPETVGGYVPFLEGATLAFLRP